MEILKDIPLELDIQEALTSLRVKKDSPYLAEAVETAKQAEALAHPRALYEVAYIEEREGDSVDIGGTWFTSRVLRRNLEGIYRVFPHIVTIGPELEKAAASSKDLVREFQLDTLGNLLLRLARNHLEAHLRERFRLEGLSRMNPGSLADWPLQEQGQLFSLFGDVQGLIGVRLTGDFLMLPRKSISGIYFPTEVPFVSCQLCPRERCIGRKAPFDPKLVAEYQRPL